MKLKMMNRNWTGLLITFCGLDGSGKTTLIDALCQYIIEATNITPHIIKQPSNIVRRSEIFRSFIDHKNYNNYDYRAMSLFAVSDRLQQSSKLILPLLQKGEVVICDRYYYSALVNMKAYGLTNDKWIYEIAQYIPKPDLSIFLDVSYQEAIRRVKNRIEERNRYIDDRFEMKLQNEFMLISKEVDGVIIPSNDSVDIAVDLIQKEFDKVYFKRGIVNYE